MTALQIIIKEAKVISKKHPKLSWQEAIKKASIIYKSKHKPKKSGKAIAGKRMVKKSAPKKSAPKKVATKKSTHKDTKSHNVRINVMSGVNDATINEIKHINDILKKWKIVLMTLEQQKKLEKNTLNKTLLKNDIYRVKNVISDLKINLNRLKKHIK
jgi:hypothetical protein